MWSSDLIHVIYPPMYLRLIVDSAKGLVQYSMGLRIFGGAEFSYKLIRILANNISVDVMNAKTIYNIDDDSISMLVYERL